jgi:hypothetical protein
MGRRVLPPMQRRNTSRPRMKRGATVAEFSNEASP